jgi:predicted DNA-binding WGR domain protein
MKSLKETKTYQKMDVLNDSKEVIDEKTKEIKLKIKNDQKLNINLTVDKNSGFKNCSILIDEKSDIPYNVFLNKIDLKKARYQMYSFYVMQIIFNPSKNLYFLFNSIYFYLKKGWGRIGDRGEFQKTPFSTKEEAIKEFKKIFISKSGNKWEDYDNFEKVDKKYNLVKLNIAKKYKLIDDIYFNENVDYHKNTYINQNNEEKKLSCEKSKIDLQVYYLMKKFTNIKIIEESMSNLDVDTDYIPFDSIDDDIFNEGIPSLLK